MGAFRSRSAVPVVYRGITLGAVYLYEYDTGQAELLQSIQSNLRYISIMIACLSLLLAMVLSKALTRSISQLLKAIRTVRQGEYSHRVALKSKDELAQLADEFNQLTGRLQTTEEARRRFVSDASHELKTPGFHPPAHGFHPPDGQRGHGHGKGIRGRYRGGGGAG